MNTNKTYNGWSNYETWVTNLCLDNDESTSKFFNERAIFWSQAESTSEVWTREESAVFNLALEIEANIETNNPLNDSASLYTDLLNAAIEEARVSSYL